MNRIWKYNDIELEFDLGDIDSQKRYEEALDKMDEAEKKLPKTGKRSEISEAYCNMFFNLFDDLFGDGTGKRLLGENRNVRIAEECYFSFVEFVRAQADEMNRTRAKAIGNKQERRRKGK